MNLNLNTPIENIPRVGQVLTKRLHRLGLKKVADLLYYYPFRYDDFSQIIHIAKIQSNANVSIKGRVNIIANKRLFRRRMFLTECLISDETGSIKAIWFNQPFITKILKQGDLVYFSGKAEYSSYGLQLMNPSYEKIKKEQTHTARIVPIYSLTESLTEKQIRYLIRLVLPLAKQLPDWLPETILKKYQLLPLALAIREIHFPTNHKILEQAQKRLKFNELFVIQLKTQSIRQALKELVAPRLRFNQPLTNKFVDSLPFQLTRSQKAAAWQILRDIHQTKPMNRLMEGDVGSGKTVVAAMAMLNVVDNGCQAVLMAPTEILAFQHFQTISKILKKFKIKIALLTRTAKKLADQETTQKNIIDYIAKGKAQVIIGTHALIQEKVSFKKLGLVVLDEQHRFGVDQRKMLKQKSTAASANEVPHLLSMTATPIPRSLALTLYGDLDLSLITEMPVGRKKILTKIIPLEKRKLAYDFLREEVKNGRQIFVICPLIEESDKLGVKAATAEYERLKKDVFPNLKIGLVHGKLKAAEKEKAMQAFANNETNILVATAVVEVGIDVPNASVMMIEGAERFGLAQLHQFRGRVGRAEHQSYCFVFTDSDSEKTIERLEALVTTNNGFALAEKDLSFRGPGEIYGVRQSGFPDLRLAKLTDYALIQQTKEAAEDIFGRDPNLTAHPQLHKKLVALSKSIHLE